MVNMQLFEDFPVARICRNCAHRAPWGDRRQPYLKKCLTLGVLKAEGDTCLSFFPASKT